MSSVRIEWVEIIEPRTREHMYANLTTGECVWDPPEGVHIKRTDDSQWWELFDKNTKRFYYYNVATQTTVWHRPTNCDIIPLAKLQTLKQNTDPSDSLDDFVPPNSKSSGSHHRLDDIDLNRHQSPSSSRGLPPSTPESRSIDILSNLSDRHSSYSRMSAGDPIGSGKTKSHRYCRHTQGSSSSHNSKQNFDSGKSSDSSISSGVHGYRRMHEGGSLRMESSQHRSKHSADNSYRKLQESSSSHNIPHVILPPEPKQPSQLLSYSASNTMDLCNSPTTAHPSGTPQFKKKLISDKHAQQPVQSKRESCGSVTKHQSFDYASNSPTVSLVRSGSFMSSPRQTNVTKKNSIDGSGIIVGTSSGMVAAGGNGGGASDDSMHEKYFKSVENTPISKRRNQSLACTSDSSPHSPMSPKKNTLRLTRPSGLGSSNVMEPAAHSHKSSQKNDDLELEKSLKHERYLDKMRKDMPNKTSPSAEAMGSPLSIQQINNLLKPSLSSNKNATSSQYEFSSSSAYRNVPSKEKLSLNVQNVERHTQLQDQKAEQKFSSYRKKKRQQDIGSDVEYDNGNISPLYSNWDQETQEHLLPLQNYIIEQAKLSGSYHLGDPLDSDSLHSDTQSEHSFSGHEPDNEDSDHSDGRGDYLAHHYSVMDDYGELYYNVNVGYDKHKKQDNISEEVEEKLESEGGQIYSPVKHYPFFQQKEKNLPKQSTQQPLVSSGQRTLEKQHQHSHHQQQQLPKQHQQQRHYQQQQQQQHQQQQQQQHQQQPHQQQPLQQPQSQQLHKQLQQQHLPHDKLPSTSAPNIFKPPIGPPQLPIMKECDIEKFAQDNLNLHSKGIFRKKSSIRDMLSWTPNTISRPMLALSRDKAGKKMATEMFKLVQIYMGDRKARDGMSLNSVALDIITTALAQPQLRDELYVQLCRQTTENHMRESLIRGWELFAICLSFVPPSPTFQPALLNYMNRHRDPAFATAFPEIVKWPIHVQVSHYASVACRRLDRIGSNGKKQAKKPTEEEINQSRDQIFRNSMFGNTLDEVMELQKDRFPYRKLPWIQVTLSEQVLLLNGKQTEGIFRVSADVDEVSYWKARLDRWDVPEHKSTMDAHAPASLLKLWYRELYDPLIPDELYNECVSTEDPEEAALIINKLPHINRMVLTYLVYFLQQFAQPDIVSCTKMDSSNLAMVFAPNCLRCTSQDPKVILENARKEMAFMRTLISHMDTSSVAKME